MIRFQIVERAGANLQKTLIEAMRTGELRTFVALKRGRRIEHTNPSYPGWMKWAAADGVIDCQVLSPRKPGREWQLFSAFLGRLADRYRGSIVAIIVQFPGEPAPANAPRRTKRRSTR